MNQAHTISLGLREVGKLYRLRICVLMCAKILKDIEHRYPKLTGGFHTNIVTVVFGKPVSQFLQAFCKGGKASLLILCTSICVSNSHTGVNPSLVNIQSTAVFSENLKCRYTAPPLTSTGSVVYRTLRGYCNKFCKCTKGRRFHNHVGAFRRKADYTQMKRGMKSCCPLVSDECCFYDAT